MIASDSENSDSTAEGSRLTGLDTKPEFDGNVERLYQVTILRPVVEFPFSLKYLTNHLSLIGKGWYLLTGTRPSVVDDFPKETIRSCMILWAENISAAVLASRCADSCNGRVTEENKLPPIEYFMPTSIGWTYGEIHRAGRGKVMESAIYGASGDFQFKLVRLDKSHLYYASQERNMDEFPFAISLTGAPN